MAASQEAIVYEASMLLLLGVPREEVMLQYEANPAVRRALALESDAKEVRARALATHLQVIVRELEAERWSDAC